MSIDFPSNCATTQSFPGTNDTCLLDLGLVARIVIASPGHSFASLQELQDVAQWDAGVAAGSLVVLPEVVNVTDNDAEQVTEEVTGRMRKVVDGERRKTYELRSDPVIYSEVRRLEERVRARRQVYLIMNDNTVLCRYDGTAYRPVPMNSFIVDTPKTEATREATAKWNVMLHLDGTYMAKNLGPVVNYAPVLFEPEDLSSVTLVYVTAGGDTAKVMVRSSAGDIAIEGLMLDNFYIDGVQASAVVEDPAGEYELTPALTAGKVVTVRPTVSALYGTKAGYTVVAVSAKKNKTDGKK